MKKDIIILLFGQNMPMETAEKYGYKVINIHTKESFNVSNLSNHSINDNTIITADIKEIENTVEKIHKSHSIIGIFSFTDRYNGTYLASKLNKEFNIFSFAPPNSIEIINNKILTREYLSTINMPNISYIVTNNKKDVYTFFNKTEKDIIIKPFDGEGSRLVSKISNLNEIDSYFQNIPSSYKNYKFIVEENIKGIEVSVEVLIINEKVHIVGVTDKVLHIDNLTNPYVEKAHIFPSRISHNKIERINKNVVNFFKNLNVKNGIAHLEFIITDQNIPFLIEAHLRPGGGGITRLINNSSNLNIYKAFFDGIFDSSSNFNIEYKNESCILFLTPKPGILKSVIVPTFSYEFINLFNVNIKEKSVIKPIKESKDTIYGEIVVTSPDKNSYEIAKSIEDRIQLDYE
ncbi:ATP-grasp domain-containing protein [Staphylococcus gallinarum]|uniref:ATP-grasp domain-containing protein n=1 Tax=Staphylococcus gallinarum TaxID=1293 RepID=UPI002DB64E49|nr:ATP-grasp domain-containing protein [Staphylococcus gallinarum]MEB7040097.1 ATP-grasp domain-containing protein [Staphylococcus gallinarum]